MDKLFLDANVIVDFLCERTDGKIFQNAQLPVYTPKEYLEMFGA